MINKKLLRKIKHEGFPLLEDSNSELLLQSLNEDYQNTNSKPYHEWSLSELFTRQEELVHLSYLIYHNHPIFYYEEYWMTGGEYYDIMDELEGRFYE